MKLTIVGPAIPNIPWQPKPAGNQDVVWRYDANPVIGRRPLPRVTGIYNSAVVPFGGKFIGVFRTEGMDRVPHLHVGRSPDGLKWTFEPKPIDFHCEDEEVRRHEYAYDPRVTPLEGVYYVTWCNGYHGPTIGIARTTDFKRFEQLENAFLPYNRNGVLFPRKFGDKFLMLSRPERHRPHALRRHFHQREPRPGPLGPPPPRHEPGGRSGGRAPRSAPAPRRSRRTKAGCSSTTA